MEDRRVRRTTNSLKFHFIELIKEKGYQAVTVTDIVEYADYNRSTFYAYYLDKDDLASSLLDSMMELLHNAFHEPFDSKSNISYTQIENNTQNTFFQHLYDHRHFYELLNVTDTLPGLNEQFLAQFKAIFLNIHYLDQDGNIITVSYYNTYKMYGSYGLLKEWVANGCQESAGEMSAAILTIFEKHASSFRFKEKKAEKSH